MPRTAHSFADDKALSERAVIVRAMGADGEDSTVGTRQQNVVVADMAKQCAAVRQRIDGNAKGKVWSL
jgi:hypothetical protein